MTDRFIRGDTALLAPEGNARRRCGWLLAAVIAIAASCSSGTGTAVGGPLQTPGNGGLLNEFGDVPPGQPRSVAAAVLYNSGSANIVLESMSAVGSRGVRVVGMGVADARLRWMTETIPAAVLTPGTYSQYPPTDDQGDPVRILSAAEAPPLQPARRVTPAPDPAEMIVFGMTLDPGVQIGRVLGVEVRYRVEHGGEFSRFLGYPAVLCRGAGTACDAVVTATYTDMHKLLKS